MERLEDISGEDIIYFSICYEEEVLRPFYEYLKKDERLNLNFYKDVYGDGLWYLEISHKNASKYYGIQKLRKLLHPAAITGMGDNLNDIPLFEACDRSCAVGNAHKEVKRKGRLYFRYQSECGSGKISGKGNEINYQDSHRIWNLPETI